MLLRRGLAAGLTAGLLAGVFGLVVGEPPLEAAIEYERTAATHTQAHSGSDEDPALSRTVQRAGLIGGTLLLGATLGVLFGVASAWAAGRVTGTAWQRSLKLGASALGALVLLPTLKYPPNPPGVGDPAMVGRTVGFLALLLSGVVLTIAAWFGAHMLRRRVADAAHRQVVVGAGVVAGAALLLAVTPATVVEHQFPAELMWRFRLVAIGTQVLLVGGVAVTFGLLSVRAEDSPQASA